MTTRKEPTFFGSLFGTAQAAPQNVDSVMAAFQNTIRDLEQVETAHRGQAAAHAAVIAEREQARNAAVAEADRASAIAGKMKAVFE